MFSSSPSPQSLAGSSYQSLNKTTRATAPAGSWKTSKQAQVALSGASLIPRVQVQRETFRASRLSELRRPRPGHQAGQWGVHDLCPPGGLVLPRPSPPMQPRAQPALTSLATGLSVPPRDRSSPHGSPRQRSRLPGARTSRLWLSKTEPLEPGGSASWLGCSVGTARNHWITS